MNADTKSGIVRRLGARARRREGGGAEAARFVGQFYRDVPEADLAAMDDLRALGGAMSTWSLLRTRKRGQPKIRVFNPDMDTDGWASPHTVVDIVNDDMPFLVDSVTAEINRHNLSVHLVAHPVLSVERDRAGRMGGLRPNGVETDGASAESVMHFEITELRRPGALERLRRDLRAVLDDVRAAVEDFDAMQLRRAEAADGLGEGRDADEARAFLGWLDERNFTFIGYREYGFDRRGGAVRLRQSDAPGLGILRNPERSVLRSISTP